MKGMAYARKKAVLILTILCLAVALFSPPDALLDPGIGKPKETQAADTSWTDIKEKGISSWASTTRSRLWAGDEETNEIVRF